ncbi:GDSL-type esterase/lipase family protein [Cellvibrio sp.]|uniref:SGNH/GDSL hydrolase family protein n=1 Tax=Cellvibrio sp. TaxID=1965322 RepID=UPI00396477B0
MKYFLIAVSFVSLLLSGCSSNTKSSVDTKKSNSIQNTSVNAPFTGKNSRLIGRFDKSTSGEAKFTWPGSAIEFRFEGTQASIGIASTDKTRFALDVEGQTKDFWTEQGNKVYTLISNLPKGTHTIRLTRVNESTAGITSFTSDPQTDGKLLTPPAAPNRKLLVIGDSITAGYGVEGANQSCHYTLDTSTQQLTYAALAAKSLDADLHAIAWSGIGAWRSYGEKTPINPSMIVRHTRTLADDINSKWNAQEYQPNAVLINIGTNDYWEGSVSNDYRDAMTKLIAQVQADYPNKPIYLIVSPMLGEKVHIAQKQVLESLAKGNIKVFDLGENNGSEGFGCDYHPNLTTHTRLAKALEANLKSELNW